MPDASAGRFAIALLVSLIVAFVLAAVIAPPDPFTQLLVVGGVMVVAAPIAYYVGYRGGYDALSWWKR